jgi:poly(A) polymerase
MIKSERFTPVHDVVSAKVPTAIDIVIDGTLKDYMDVHMKLETDEEMERRAMILLKVEKIFKNFVLEVGIDVLRMEEDDVKAAGGELFISGSHRLGVREPGADIDTICVAPNFCTREHFFTLLKQQLMNHSDVTNFGAAEGARVPIMSFDFEGVSIDLLFARLADNIVPPKLDILDDKILIGIDEATEKSLNGTYIYMYIYIYIYVYIYIYIFMYIYIYRYEYI